MSFIKLQTIYVIMKNWEISKFEVGYVVEECYAEQCVQVYLIL